MTIWFTSDLHFGHKNIIKYSRRFLAVDPDKPTKAEVEAMDRLLIENWNRVVQPEDRVYHLGDWAFCTSDPHARECIKALNGDIYAVPGNHDELAHRLYCEDPTLFTWMEAVAHINVEGQEIVLCHYAMREWHHALRGTWHLFGHTHGCLQPFGKSVDVGVDNAYNVMQASNVYVQCGMHTESLCETDARRASTLRPVSFEEVRAYMAAQSVGSHAEFGHGFVPSHLEAKNA